MKALFLGDFCPTKEFSAPLFKKKDIETLFTDTVTLFDGKDFRFVNLECAITESDNAIEKFGPNLKAPFETAEVLKELQVDCCGLSNNHFFDFGIEGAMDTLKALEEVGIQTTGFGNNYEDSRKNLVIEKDGQKICLITVCEHEYSYALEDRMGCRPFDEFETLEDVRAAKAENDRVILIYHGGKEHCKYPSPRLMRACRAMARAGADMILCQHSHCIGCYEQYQGCHILYGQGNFHFIHESNEDGWFSALAVEYDTKSHKIAFTPIKALKDGITLAKGEEAKAIMAAFEKRNEELQNGEWKKGWHAFCERMSEKYVNVIANACKEHSEAKDNHRFGHYLDCEAHTDVWKELFPTANQTNEK